MIGFVLGALIGAGSTWYWGDRIRALADSNMSETASSHAGALGEAVIRAVTTDERARTMRERRRASEIIVGHEPRPLAVAWPT
jgi:hypothetical protein